MKTYVLKYRSACQLQVNYRIDCIHRSQASNCHFATKLYDCRYSCYSSLGHDDLSQDESANAMTPHVINSTLVGLFRRLWLPVAQTAAECVDRPAQKRYPPLL
jgi:hypothetical protein